VVPFQASGKKCVILGHRKPGSWMASKTAKPSSSPVLGGASPPWRPRRRKPAQRSTVATRRPVVLPGAGSSTRKPTPHLPAGNCARRFGQPGARPIRSHRSDRHPAALGGGASPGCLTHVPTSERQRRCARASGTRLVTFVARRRATVLVGSLPGPALDQGNGPRPSVQVIGEIQCRTHCRIMASVHHGAPARFPAEYRDDHGARRLRGERCGGQAAGPVASKGASSDAIGGATCGPRSRSTTSCSPRLPS